MRTLLICVALSAQAGTLDDYLLAAARARWDARRAALAGIRTPRQAADRQRYIRRTFLEALGGFPERTPLHARITGNLTREGYRVENLVFESQPGFYVTANVYVPTAGKPPFPAILGTAGHSAEGKAYPVYQRAWIGLARRGFVVLAYDPPGQGERLEYFDPVTNRPPRFSQHLMAGALCYLTGANLARYELWDGIRAYDYLLTRRDVDPKRIGVAGNSGGGTQTAYLQVVEPRLGAAAPSCYITSWEKLWFPAGPQDSEQTLANFIGAGLDFSDYLIAFAPKPVKVMTAIRDMFPIDGARATYREARRIYELMGAEERIGFFEYDDGHGWSLPRREATYAWMQRWLQKGALPTPEGEFATEPPSVLQCTPTGQVLTSYRGESVLSLNRKLAGRIYPARTATRVKTRAEFARLVATRLGMEIDPLARRTPPPSFPGTLRAPETPGRKPVLIYVDPQGAPPEMPDRIVFAPELRGWGNTATVSKTTIYEGDWKNPFRAFLLGKTFTGMQVEDLLAALDYVLARPDADPARVELAGRNHGAYPCVYAAALDARIRKLTVTPRPLSYMEMIREPEHKHRIELIVPGVLRDFDLPDVIARITVPTEGLR